MATFTTVKDYLDQLNPEVLKKLNEVRNIILNIDKRIIEYTAYGILGYKLDTYKFYVGAYKSHIGIYGNIASVIALHKEALSHFKTFKGTIQLPFDEPLPIDLIKSLTKKILNI